MFIETKKKRVKSACGYSAQIFSMKTKTIDSCEALYIERKHSCAENLQDDILYYLVCQISNWIVAP